MPTHHNGYDEVAFPIGEEPKAETPGELPAAATVGWGLEGFFGNAFAFQVCGGVNGV